MAQLHTVWSTFCRKYFQILRTFELSSVKVFPRGFGGVSWTLSGLSAPAARRCSSGLRTRALLASRAVPVGLVPLSALLGAAYARSVSLWDLVRDFVPCPQHRPAPCFVFSVYHSVDLSVGRLVYSSCLRTAVYVDGEALSTPHSFSIPLPCPRPLPLSLSPRIVRCTVFTLFPAMHTLVVIVK